MANIFLVNINMNRLPMLLSGITYAFFGFTGGVYSKLNIKLKRSKLSLPLNKL